MDKKLVAAILGILVGSLVTSPMFSFAQEETASDKPEAHCDWYDKKEEKIKDKKGT